MKRIRSLQDPLLARHLQNVLESNGIPCYLRNESLRIAQGEVPMPECWLELWIDDDADVALAEKLVSDDALVTDDSSPGWRCGGCSEEIDAQFDACWKCGADRT